MAHKNGKIKEEGGQKTTIQAYLWFSDLILWDLEVLEVNT